MSVEDLEKTLRELKLPCVYPSKIVYEMEVAQHKRNVDDVLRKFVAFKQDIEKALDDETICQDCPNVDFCSQNEDCNAFKFLKELLNASSIDTESAKKEP